MDLPPPSIERIKNQSTKVDLGKYVRFLKSCEDHQPWLWKDPRLCYTIHFWSRIAEFDDCKFIFTTRDPSQEFAAMIRRRTIVSERQIREVNAEYKKSLCVYLDEAGKSCLFSTFEEMMLQPNEYLMKLNDFLGIDLTLSDLRSIYRGKFGKKKYTLLDIMKSHFIYAYFRYLRGEYVQFSLQETRRKRRK
jgi:hypothetical protein